MAKQTQIASDILEAIGGKENVASVTHCMTRLRFTLKDEGLSSDDVLKKINGVITVIHAGGQVQIVIGTSVDKVYDEVCKQGNFEVQSSFTEKSSGTTLKEKLTPKTILNNVLNAISGSITPILPIFIAAGIFKMVAVLFGPKNLALLSDTSNLYVICNLVSNAGFYYLPIFIAYSAAKKFNCNPIMALLLSAIMIHPDMLAIVNSGEPFTIFAIPMEAVNYTQAVFPVIIITWVMSYVEKWLKKIIPDMLRTIGIPVLTMVIMLPLGLCVLGPICETIMGFLASIIIWMTTHVGLPTIVVVGALWSMVIAFGMHVPVMTALLPTWLEMGYDAIVSPATIASAIANLGVELGYALRAKGKENKSLGWSCFVTNATANIGEPYIYGIYLRDRKALLWHMIGAASGALTMGILGAKITMFSGVGFPWLSFLRFGEYALQGGIGMIVAFVVSFTLSIIFGFEGSKKREVNLFHLKER